MMDVYQITLKDVVTKLDVSVRLKNSILAAYDLGWMPINTIGEVVIKGDEIDTELKKIPNMGIKTIRELKDLVYDIVENGGLVTALDEEHRGLDSLSEELASTSLYELVNTRVVSERLKNSISRAWESDEIPYTTVEEYIHDGSSAITNIKKIPGMGNKTVNELDTLIKELIKESVKENKIHKLDDVNNDITEQEIVTVLLKKFQHLLSEKEFDVLKERSIAKKTLEEIGNKYDVTRERVRQIEKKAKIKIIKVYREQLKVLSNKLDEILDDNYGEVKLNDVSNVLEVPRIPLILLVYVISGLCREEIILKRNIIQRKKIEDNHSEWNQLIDEVLYSCSWPITVSDVKNKIEEIPETYLERYLVDRRGAVINNDQIVQLNRIPQSARMSYVFRSAKKELRPFEMVKLYKQMFNIEIDEHNAQSITGRMDNALIVDRGVYNLYENIDLNIGDLEYIRNKTYEYLLKENKYISSKVLYDILFKEDSSISQIKSPYVIHGILQDDERFVTRRGLMVGVKELAENIVFTSLTEEIWSCVQDNGPIRISSILEKLSKHRKVLYVNVSKICEESNNIIRVEPAVYDMAENIFGSVKQYEKFKIALQLATAIKQQGLFELTRNMRNIQTFNDVKVTTSLVASVVSKIADIEIKQHVYRYKGKNDNLLKHALHGVAEVDKELQEKDKIQTYEELDYRKHQQVSSSKKQTNQEDVVDNILSSFI